MSFVSLFSINSTMLYCLIPSCFCNNLESIKECKSNESTQKESLDIVHRIPRGERVNSSLFVFSQTFIFKMSL